MKTNNTLEDNLESVVNTGVWWINPWWEKEEYLESIDFSLEEVRSLISLLKKEFPKEWAKRDREKIVSHPFLRKVCYGEGLFPLSYLLNLANTIKKVRECSGSDSVIKKLRSDNMAEASDMELTFAETLISSAYKIEFPAANSKKGKTPDILVSDEEPLFAIECKKLNRSEKEIWLENFNLHLTFEVGKILKNEDGKYIFRFDNFPIHKAVKGTEWLLDPKEEAGRWLGLIEESYRQNILEGACLRYLYVEEVGDCLFIDPSNEEAGSMYMPELQDSDRYLKLMANGIERASKQLLDRPYPGLAVIYSEELPDIEFLASSFELDCLEKYEVLKNTYAVLLARAQGLGEYRRPFLLYNNHCENKNVPETIIAALKKAYDPIVVEARKSKK